MKLERRFQELESLFFDDSGAAKFDKDLVAAYSRVRAGTARTSDYDLATPGLLRHTRRVLTGGATTRRLRRVLGDAVEVKPSPERPSTHSERNARLLFHLQWSPLGPEAIRPQLFFELLRAGEGDEQGAAADLCSYFETEATPPEYRESLERARRSSDAAQRARANLFLVALQGDEERRIKRAVERSVPIHVLAAEGEEGQFRRLAAKIRSGCEGDNFDCRHDRLPPTCYDKETAMQCECQNRPRPDRIDVDAINERARQETAAAARRIGAREHVPDD